MDGHPVARLVSALLPAWLIVGIARLHLRHHRASVTGTLVVDGPTGDIIVPVRPGQPLGRWPLTAAGRYLQLHVDHQASAAHPGPRNGREAHDLSAAIHDAMAGHVHPHVNGYGLGRDGVFVNVQPGEEAGPWPAELAGLPVIVQPRPVPQLQGG